MIYLQLQSRTATEFDMVVLDITGRKVFSDVIYAQQGLNPPFTLDAKDYYQGVYIIQLIDRLNGEMLEEKFIKQ